LSVNDDIQDGRHSDEDDDGVRAICSQLKKGGNLAADEGGEEEEGEEEEGDEPDQEGSEEER